MSASCIHVAHSYKLQVDLYAVLHQGGGQRPLTPFHTPVSTLTLWTQTKSVGLSRVSLLYVNKSNNP